MKTKTVYREEWSLRICYLVLVVFALMLTTALSCLYHHIYETIALCGALVSVISGAIVLVWPIPHFQAALSKRKEDEKYRRYQYLFMFAKHPDKHKARRHVYRHFDRIYLSCLHTKISKAELNLLHEVVERLKTILCEIEDCMKLDDYYEKISDRLGDPTAA